ncbi:hypothetical protein LWI28_003592 [Acer negundo]|uniref:Uncharacterized protein n=1 Tax=Acer negundo TaxID=4023 RepID=A0AAD5NUQ1_ACENE|nr:hypothetical protein LWI28_003592 [Acer negundo]
MDHTSFPGQGFRKCQMEINLRSPSSVLPVEAAQQVAKRACESTTQDMSHDGLAHMLPGARNVGVPFHDCRSGKAFGSEPRDPLHSPGSSVSAMKSGYL